MESRHGYSAKRSYEDFDPVFTWHSEKGRDTLELHLPGFRRDQIRIQINHLGFLVISGERAVDGSRWKRFKKEFEIPSYCNEDGIHGNFMQSILSVVMPKKKDTLNIPQEDQQRQIPETQHHKKKNDQNLNFEEHGSDEEIENTAKEELEEDTYHHTTQYQFEENDVKLTPETTREVAFKFMVVIIVILVIASYLADMSKSLMAEAKSYFHK